MNRLITAPRDCFYAIEPGALENICNIVKAAGASYDINPSDPPKYAVREGTAFISMTGPLTKHPTSMGALLGGTSTREIGQQMRLAKMDASVKRICLVIDSPGGEVSGTNDLAQIIKEISRSIPTVAFIEDCGCSAAYWIAASCDLIVCNETAMVGSIGTVAIISDTSEKARAEGIKVHVVASGPYKGKPSPGAEVDEETIGKAQEMVNKLASVFKSSIMTGRDFTEDQIEEIATGEVWIGAGAKERGLVDEVMSLDDLVEWLRDDKTMSKKTFTTASILKALGINAGIRAEEEAEKIDESIEQTPDKQDESQAIDEQHLEAAAVTASSSNQSLIDAQSDVLANAKVDSFVFAGTIVPAAKESLRTLYKAAFRGDFTNGTCANVQALDAFVASQGAITAMLSPQIQHGQAVYEQASLAEGVGSEQAKSMLGVHFKGSKFNKEIK